MNKRQRKKNNTYRKISNAKMNSYKARLIKISNDIASICSLSVDDAIKSLDTALRCEIETIKRWIITCKN